MLDTTPFGTTDMNTTRVGFGAWAVGGGGWRMGWGQTDDSVSIAAMRCAVELGINWIDTAAVYGRGHSEDLVGEALSVYAVDERPYVFTKCGRVWDPDDLSTMPETVVTAASIRLEAEQSLRRLRVERIDLYQVHWPAVDQTPIDEYWSAMLALRDEGKVRAIGLCNHSVPQLEVAQALGQVQSVQSPLSLIRRESAENVIPWAATNNTAMLAYSPMQSGLLTGAMTRERIAAMPDDDWRHSHPDFTERLDANLALVDAMRPVADRHDVSLSAIAVAWVLSWSGVTGAIVGARRPDQIDAWLAGASVRLNAADLDELAAGVRRCGAGGGPERPPHLPQ